MRYNCETPEEVTSGAGEMQTPVRTDFAKASELPKAMVSTCLPPLTTAVLTPAVFGSTPVISAPASNPLMSPGESGEC